MLKIYSHKEIMCATFLGGPIATGWLMAHNYRAFKETKKAIRALAISISFTIVLLEGLYWLDSIVIIPRHLVPVTYIIITHFIIKRYQDDKISDYLHSGGDLFSGWRVTLISLIILALTLSASFGLDYAVEKADAMKYSVVNYGELNSEVKYQNKNVTSIEAHVFANAFFNLGYGTSTGEIKINQKSLLGIGSIFGSGLFNLGYSINYGKKFILVDKINNNYELTISIDGFKGRQLSSVDDAFSVLRRELQKYFPGDKVILNLERNDIVVIRIES